MTERLARASCAGGREFESQDGLILHSFNSNHTQAIVLPWRYVIEMSPANFLHALA